MIALGQHVGFGRIEIAHTNDLRPGDVLWVQFPFGSGGWFKYGGEESFTVLSVDPGTGDVTSQDESGSAATFGGGSEAEMLAWLADLTNFISVTVLRAEPETPIDVELRLLATWVGAEDWDRVPMPTFEGVEAGDIVVLDPPDGFERVLLVSGAPVQEVVITEIIYSEKADDMEGAEFLLDALTPLGAYEAVFRPPSLTKQIGKIPGSSLLLVGGAIAVGAVFLFLK